jgi:multidrug transporter EmrE-like cation transporter
MPWLYLGTAIVAEVIATSVLKASEGFTRLIPSLVVLAAHVRGVILNHTIFAREERPARR